jgi:hypothetical protein
MQDRREPAWIERSHANMQECCEVSTTFEPKYCDVPGSVCARLLGLFLRQCHTRSSLELDNRALWQCCTQCSHLVVVSIEQMSTLAWKPYKLEIQTLGANTGLIFGMKCHEIRACVFPSSTCAALRSHLSMSRQDSSRRVLGLCSTLTHLSVKVYCGQKVVHHFIPVVTCVWRGW